MQSSKSFHWDNETDFSWFYCGSAHSMGEWGTVISCSFLRKQWVIIARLVKSSLGGYACPHSEFQYPSFFLVKGKPCPCYSITIKKIVFVLFFIIVIVSIRLYVINPLSPNSDQDQFSPNNIHTLSRDKLWELIKWSPERKCPDLSSNFLN